MRVSPGPHPAMLVFINIKCTHVIVVDISTVRISEGPGGEYRLLKVPYCEYAMRGSKRPHPVLIVSSSTKWSYAVLFDISTVRILDAAGCEYRLVEVPFCKLRNAWQ